MQKKLFTITTDGQKRAYLRPVTRVCCFQSIPMMAAFSKIEKVTDDGEEEDW